MSAALRFRETLSGFVDFDATGCKDGYDTGRSNGTRLRLRLTLVVDDLDRFIAGPERRALVRGWMDFDEQGGSFPVVRGQFKLGTSEVGPLGPRMEYDLGLRTERGQSLTVHGVKRLKAEGARNAWRETTRLDTEVLHGDWRIGAIGPDEKREAMIAAGMVRLTVPGLVAQVASVRPKARGRMAGGRAVGRFAATVGGGLADTYLPRLFPSTMPGAASLQAGSRSLEPLKSDAWKRHEEEDHQAAKAGRYVGRPWDGRLNLRVHTPPQQYRRNSVVTLEHLTPTVNARTPNGPVLLVAGSSVGASIFRPPGNAETIVHRLIREGFDVWVENWRGSLGGDPSEYSLDEAAVLDHTEAIRYVLEETDASTMKALVHCLGSSSFTLALASGQLPGVSHVASNAVSLHPEVPRGAERKIRALAPVFNRLAPYLDPQWARDDMDNAPRDTGPVVLPTSRFSDAVVKWVRLTHSESESDVCSFAHFMYGSGPSTLYEEHRLTPETRKWMETQVSWAPVSLYRQLARSLIAGRLVPMRSWPSEEVPVDPFRDGPVDQDTKITFFTGLENRTFSPRSQQRTWEWFEHFQPGRHEFVGIEDFGHLDVWIRPDADRVYDVVVNALTR